MRFSITSLFAPLLFVGSAVLASPIDDRSIDLSKSVVVPATSALVAHPDAVLPKFKLPAGATNTSPNTGLHSLSISLADSVVLCGPHDCSSCVAYALSGAVKNICYSPASAFFSGYLYIATGINPGYTLYVSNVVLPHCGTAQAFSINTCTNVANGVSAYSFFLQ